MLRFPSVSACEEAAMAGGRNEIHSTHSVAVAFGAAMMLASGLCAPPVQAAYTATLEQERSDVVATGSGTIDLVGLTFVSSGSGDEAGISGGLGIIVLGPVNFQPSDGYGRFAGPTSFGILGLITASSGSGDRIGIDRDSGELFRTSGYVSNSILSSSATWDNKSFASLGVTPGTYVWSWGSVLADDTFTLKIGVPIAEPSGARLLGLPLGLVMLLAARRRRDHGRFQVSITRHRLGPPPAGQPSLPGCQA